MHLVNSLPAGRCHLSHTNMTPYAFIAGTSAPGSLGTKSARYMTPKSPVRRCKSLDHPSSTLNWGQGWHPAPTRWSLV